MNTVLEALSQNEIKKHLRRLSGWKYSSQKKLIRREAKTKDFMEAVRLIGRIARLAQAADHHPDLHLTGYRKLEIVLSTHAVKGLTVKDFALASKIDRLEGLKKK